MTTIGHLLEIGVQSTSFDHDDQRFLASIAISLKRIADALEAADMPSLSTTLHDAIASGIWDARPKS